MTTKFFRNSWLVRSIIFLFLSGTWGCATTSIITNWDELPKNKPILVTTNSGEQLRFDQWRFERDGSTLVGLTRARAYAIPTHNISQIATIDESKQKLAETSVIVVGSIVGVVLLVYIVRAITGFHFGKT